MSRYDYGRIDPDIVAGTELAAMPHQQRDALHAQHKGSAKPAYVVAGTRWLNDGGTPWLIKRYDGLADVVEAEFNAADDTVSCRHRSRVISRTADYSVVATDFGRIVKVDAALGRYVIRRLLSPRDEGLDLDEAAWRQALALTLEGWGELGTRPTSHALRRSLSPHPSGEQRAAADLSARPNRGRRRDSLHRHRCELSIEQQRLHRQLSGQ